MVRNTCILLLLLLGELGDSKAEAEALDVAPPMIAAAAVLEADETLPGAGSTMPLTAVLSESAAAFRLPPPDKKSLKPLGTLPKADKPLQMRRHMKNTIKSKTNRV